MRLHSLRIGPSRSCTQLLVGNKSDLTGSRVVTFDQGHDFASKHGMGFFETSAKVNHSVEEAFISLGMAIKES